MRACQATPNASITTGFLVAFMNDVPVEKLLSEAGPHFVLLCANNEERNGFFMEKSWRALNRRQFRQ